MVDEALEAEPKPPSMATKTMMHSTKLKPNSKLRRVKTKNHGNALQIVNADIKIILGFGIIAALIIFFLVNYLINPAEEARRPRVVTPFPSPKIMDLPQVHVT